MNKCEICKCNKICDHNNYGFEICNNFIPEDVVEVVRCKDCKDFERHGNGKRGVCRNTHLKPCLRYDADYCSYGERKE